MQVFSSEECGVAVVGVGVAVVVSAADGAEVVTAGAAGVGDAWALRTTGTYV